MMTLAHAWIHAIHLQIICSRLSVAEGRHITLTCFRGHDNCEHGSIFEDEASVYLNSGTIQAHELQAEQLVRSFPVSHNAEFQPRS